jgi:hypothetical protein
MATRIRSGWLASSSIEAQHHRHWSPTSHSIAPADVLVAYLKLGWQLDPLVIVEENGMSGARMAEVYRFRLSSGGETLEMPVLMNPIVAHICAEKRLTIRKA